METLQKADLYTQSGHFQYKISQDIGGNYIVEISSTGGLSNLITKSFYKFYQYEKALHFAGDYLDGKRLHG